MEKVKIVSVGQPDPEIGNCGHHEIGVQFGTIYVWFSDLHELKTAEEALEVAERIVKAMNELRIIKSR
jgi:hypothetical protein